MIHGHLMTTAGYDKEDPPLLHCSCDWTTLAGTGALEAWLEHADTAEPASNPAEVQR